MAFSHGVAGLFPPFSSSSPRAVEVEGTVGGHRTFLIFPRASIRSCRDFASKGVGVANFLHFDSACICSCEGLLLVQSTCEGLLLVQSTCEGLLLVH